jgi:hypothetical protein
VVNGSEKKPQLSPSSSTKSVACSSKAEIETWLDKDARGHAFVVFNIKPNIACQSQEKVEELPMNYGNYQKHVP